MDHSDSDQDNCGNFETDLTDSDYHDVFDRCRIDCDPEHDPITWKQSFMACNDCKEKLAEKLKEKQAKFEEYKKQHKWD